jgi:Glutathione S-transferase, N-terminal domain
MFTSRREVAVLLLKVLSLVTVPPTLNVPPALLLMTNLKAPPLALIVPVLNVPLDVVPPAACVYVPTLFRPPPAKRVPHRTEVRKGSGIEDACTPAPTNSICVPQWRLGEMTGKLVLWGVGTTRTIRVHWALHELGLDYETRPILPRSGQTKTPEYTALNARQKIPLLEDGDFRIGESAAIVAYLSQTYSTPEHCLIPQDKSLQAPHHVQARRVQFGDNEEAPLEPPRSRPCWPTAANTSWATSSPRRTLSSPPV